MLNEQQCRKLDAILMAFGDRDYLNGEKLLDIEPDERKANALVNVLASRGFVERTDVEESDLPLLLSIDSSAALFLENGGFITELENENTRKSSQGNISIHAIGNGHIINTGNVGGSLTISSRISVRDVVHFRKELREVKVSEEDIQEVAAIIVQEEPIDNGFGPKVNEWFRKMIGKSLDGTWEVALSAAGGVLSQIINKYYGI